MYRQASSRLEDEQLPAELQIHRVFTKAESRAIDNKLKEMDAAAAELRGAKETGRTDLIREKQLELTQIIRKLNGMLDGE